MAIYTGETMVAGNGGGITDISTFTFDYVVDSVEKLKGINTNTTAISVLIKKGEYEYDGDGSEWIEIPTNIQYIIAEPGTIISLSNIIDGAGCIVGHDQIKEMRNIHVLSNDNNIQTTIFYKCHNMYNCGIKDNINSDIEFFFYDCHYLNNCFITNNTAPAAQYHFYHCSNIRNSNVENRSMSSCTNIYNCTIGAMENCENTYDSKIVSSVTRCNNFHNCQFTSDISECDYLNNCTATIDKGATMASGITVFSECRYLSDCRTIINSSSQTGPQSCNIFRTCEHLTNCNGYFQAKFSININDSSVYLSCTDMNNCGGSILLASTVVPENFNSYLFTQCNGMRYCNTSGLANYGIIDKTTCSSSPTYIAAYKADNTFEGGWNK